MVRTNSNTTETAMSEQITMNHAVERTNHKGEAFIGRCILCGEEGLTMVRSIKEHCPNLLEVTDDQALLVLIDKEKS